MDAVKFIKERDRMCKSYYDAEKGYCSDECPAHDVQCSDLDGLSSDAEELVTLVEEWSASHPRKTRQSMFLEQWPNAARDRRGVMNVCPMLLDVDISCADSKTGRRRTCDDCRKEFWMQEVE